MGLLYFIFIFQNGTFSRVSKWRRRGAASDLPPSTRESWTLGLLVTTSVLHTPRLLMSLPFLVSTFFKTTHLFRTFLVRLFFPNTKFNFTKTARENTSYFISSILLHSHWDADFFFRCAGYFKRSVSVRLVYEFLRREQFRNIWNMGVKKNTLN